MTVTAAPEEKRLFTNKMLKALIIPLVIEQFLNIFVGTADSIMVAGVGEEALSSVSLVDMLNVVIMNIFAALATGGAVAAAHFIGARDFKKASLSSNQLLLVTLVISLIVTVLVCLFKKPIIDLFFGAIEPEVMENALIYLTISAISYPFIAIFSASNALFRSVGKSGTTMILSMVMNAINIFGNAILIYGFNMGVKGAAYATLVARAANALIGIYLLSRPGQEISINLPQILKPDFSMIKRILRIGVPNGLENSFFQLGRVLVTGIIAVFGTTQIAANATANALAAIATTPSAAISLAVITVVGQCVGAGNLKQATYYIKKMMKISYLMMAVMGILLIAFLPVILKLYNLTPETERLAYILILIHTGFGIFMWPASFNLPNVLRAVNNAAYTMVVAITSMVIFRIALSYIVGLWLGWGAIGVWLAMVADWTFRIICWCIRLFSGKWKKKALLL